MAPPRITARDLASMTTHWLATPVNGYLGSSYGSDLKSLLQTPMAAGLAEGNIAKARQDIPLLLVAPADAMDVYAQDIGMDQKKIVFAINVGGEEALVDGGQTTILDDNSPLIPGEPGLLDTISQTSASALNQLLHQTLPTPGYF